MLCSEGGAERVLSAATNARAYSEIAWRQSPILRAAVRKALLRRLRGRVKELKQLLPPEDAR